MTVIAYSSKHRTMAADSRCADDKGEVHLTDCHKILRLKSGALVGMAGDGDARDLMALLERATPSRMPSRKRLAALQSDVEALVVFPNGKIFTVTAEFLERGEGKHGMWVGEVLEIEDPIAAIGSGAPFAIGAMEHGADPFEAVRIACKRDLLCADPVTSMELQ